MRELTIHRKKTIVGCAAKLKVYIEDSLSSELNINGVPCRMLGTLKNGEAKTFLVEDTAVKVFVIADKLSRNYCNEYVTLPAGDEPVSLSGKCHFSPFAGNPFRFEGEVSQEVLENRKKNSRKGLPIIIAAAAIGALIGVLAVRLPMTIAKNQPKDFTAEGMQITLTAEYRQVSLEGMTVSYERDDSAVLALKEPFTLMDGFAECTLEDYFQMIRQANGMDDTTKLQQSQGVNFFEYRSEVDEEGSVYYYLCAIYKGPDAFWMVHFSCPATKADDYRDDFLSWAGSVTFPGA